MLRRPLPGTDLQISVLGLGCWPMGRKYWGEPQPDEVSIATIHAARDVGIDWVDTAPLYGDGHADAVIVRALADAGDEVRVFTKVGPRTGPDGHAVCDLSAAHVRADVEASLARLRRDVLDLVQVHWPCDLGTPLEETWGALVALRDEGKIRWLGVCNHDAETLRAVHAIAPVVALQTPYSLLRRELELGLGPTATGLGIGILAYETLCRGLLAGRYAPGHEFPASDLRSFDDRFAGIRFVRSYAVARDLRRAAGRVGVPVTALAAGWVLSRPGITGAIVGARTPEQVRDNARGAELVRRPTLWRVVEGIVTAHGV